MEPRRASGALPDIARLRSSLSESTRWRDVGVVDETGSTNADLIARVDRGEDIDGAVLIAGRQTAGRGRHARVWETPDGQLAISAALRVPAHATPVLGWLSLLTGLAVHDALVGVTGSHVHLKWPNDVLAPDGGKLSGILSEYRPATGGGGTAVIGTGINLDLPADAATGRGSSVRDLVGDSARGDVAVVDATDVAVAYLTALSRRLESWPDAIDDLLEDYRAASTTLGTRVRLILPGGTEVVGEASAVDAEGRIVVDAPDGPVVASAGDVTHLRPAVAD
ncbi:biotin--[acetyl-CoA-carboxylase] ligase [Gordonia shandongensis]|uniref:biotin--[acetyl-CoA-carboxylase] ligase n=1 Tax=Gordonia shandongensis TaxID=376351 RepID=UPI000422EF37|nr:biotin--[acetyl-CoA-carboxylase] ligase [Gordonia shandongensis]